MNTLFKAMFWKECHENARWAVLAGLALTLGLSYAGFHLAQQSFMSNLSQFWSAENLVLTITMPLIGLALGLMQILPELRRDQWAFLVHRPASRTTLFWGKVLPGVCLYLLATVLPLLGLAAWAAQPSHIPAPFDFRFTLAGWSSVLSGLPFYSAGLLIARRPARWYGSRALPILTALIGPCAGALYWFGEFWQVALVCLAVTGVLLYAAWGSFVTSGDYAPQTRSARFALGLTLYPSVVAVAVFTLVLLFGAYTTLTHSRNQEGWRNTQKIDAQGRVFWQNEHFDHLGNDKTTVTDLAGIPVDPRVWENLNRNHRIFDLSSLNVLAQDQAYSRYFDPGSYVLNLTSEGSEAQQTYWYYETAAHQIIRDSVTDKRPPVISYLGPSGMGQDRKQAGKFEDAKPESIEFDGLHLLRFPKALYLYNTSVPAIHLLQPLPGGPGGTTTLSRYSGGYIDSRQVGQAFDVPQLLIVASGSQLTAYRGRSGNAQQPPVKLFTIHIALDPKSYSNIQVAVSPDGSRFFFLYQPGPLTAATHLVTVASNGSVLKSEVLAVKDLYAAPKMRFTDAFYALAFPPVALMYAALYGYVGHRLDWSSAQGLGDAATAGPVLFFAALSGLVAAILAGFISRRCGDARRGQIAWAVGTFWLGMYGILLLLALRAWPARLSCPNCGRPRVVDRDSCEYCGAEWMRPRQDGTEIFDTDERQAAAR